VRKADADEGVLANRSRRLETTLEVVNCMDEPINARIFECGHSMHAAALLMRQTLADAMISPGYRRLFKMAYMEEDDGAEAEFDVEIRLGFRKAKCEVVGEQIVYVDAMDL